MLMTAALAMPDVSDGPSSVCLCLCVSCGAAWCSPMAPGTAGHLVVVM